MEKKEYITGVVTGVLVTLCVGAAAFLGYQLAEIKMTTALNRHTKDKIQYIESVVESEFFGEIDVEYMREGMYMGLLAGLDDPYSRYYTAEEYAELTKENDGSYVGIGVVIQNNADGKVEIYECYKGASAEMSGILTGDIVRGVNGADVTFADISEVVNMIAETEGDCVELLIEREGEEDLLTFSVPIRDVELQYVFSEMYDETIGYINITEFSGVTYKQYTEAFEELKRQGMEKLVVDLRNNPGGLYSSVCNILDDILPEGLIVYTEDKYGVRDEISSDAEAPLGIEMAVLVNGYSASASEIFAGAIQDYGTGTIVGTTTFGKGVVQSLYPMSDGSAMKLTVSKYYTPNGNEIHKVGIQPDVVVELEEEKTEENRMEDINNEESSIDENNEEMNSAEENKWDNQVEAAVEILTSMQ